MRSGISAETRLPAVFIRPFCEVYHFLLYHRGDVFAKYFLAAGLTRKNGGKRMRESFVLTPRSHGNPHILIAESGKG